MDEERQIKNKEGAGLIIYIVLAVIIAVTMIVSVVTAVNRRKQKNNVPEAAETTETTAAETTGRSNTLIPHINTPSKDTEPAVTTAPKPVETEPETEAATTTEKTEPTVVERVYVVPVRGYVLKDYTMDMPVYSVTMNDYRVHNGTDLSASVGDPVYSFTDGVVSKIYTDPMMGQTVEIDHGDGLVSVYQNMQITLPDGIEVGAEVASGDVIGAVGETSLIECAEVPHLHFTIMKNGVCEPPSDYLGSIQFTDE